jgi:ABC-type transport system involved in multi-copper enzyme maturation permease subunit
MIGPVLYQEIVLGARRSRLYVFRWVFAGWLIINILWIAFVHMLNGKISPGGSRHFTEQVSADFAVSLVIQQYALVLLATPAIVAGAITDEKRNNTLHDLLVTDLLPWQIIVGKLVARMAQIWLLILTTLPLVAFLGVLGGMEPIGIVAVYVTLVFPIFGVGAASLLASVWTKQTRDAVLGVYLFALIAFVICQLLAWDGMPFLKHLFDPMYTLQPAWGKIDSLAWNSFLWRILESAAAWGLLGTGCLVIASLRLRGAFVRQMENSSKKKSKRWWQFHRPPVSVEPIPWKERHVEGLAPLPLLRGIPRWMGVVLIFTGTSILCFLILISAMTGTFSQNFQKVLALATAGEGQKLLATLEPAHDDFYWLNVGAMFFFSLLIGIRCSGAVCGERERKCWDALLLTPLTEKELINGKLWGIINTCWPYYIAFLVPTLWGACLSDLSSWYFSGNPHFGAIAFTVIWAGVTCLAMYFVGASGIWCSTRSKGTWRALLFTILWSYVGACVVLVVASPVLVIVAVVLWLLIMLVDYALQLNVFVKTGPGVALAWWLAIQILCCVTIAVISFLLSLAFLHYSRKYIAYRERTREWDADRGRYGYGRRSARYDRRYDEEFGYPRRR